MTLSDCCCIKATHQKEKSPTAPTPHPCNHWGPLGDMRYQLRTDHDQTRQCFKLPCASDFKHGQACRTRKEKAWTFGIKKINLLARMIASVCRSHAKQSQLQICDRLRLAPSLFPIRTSGKHSQPETRLHSSCCFSRDQAMHSLKEIRLHCWPAHPCTHRPASASWQQACQQPWLSGPTRKLGAPDHEFGLGCKGSLTLRQSAAESGSLSCSSR